MPEKNPFDEFNRALREEPDNNQAVADAARGLKKAIATNPVLQELNRKLASNTHTTTAAPPQQHQQTQQRELSPELQSLSRSEQARINGAKSRGPVTPEGKARSSRNALKHGFTAKINVLLHCEDPEAFAAHLAGYRDSYRPTNYVESEFVDKLANLSWRQARFAGLETHMIDFQMSIQKEKVDKFFPSECDNPNFTSCLTIQALAQEPYPRPYPVDPNTPPDPTIPPASMDINGIELARRYQLSLDRQFRSALAAFRQYRKDFAPAAAAPHAQIQEPVFKPEPEPEPVAASTANAAERNEPNSQPLPPTAPEPDTPKGSGGDLAAFAFPVMERNNPKHNNSQHNCAGPNEPNASTRPPGDIAPDACPAANQEAA